MNIYQKEVLEILKSSLVDEKYKLSQDINLEFFKTEAIEHALLPLLYYYLDKENLNFIEGNECLNDIKKIYISSNFFQMNMFKIVKKISEDLFDIGIEIIILKG